METENTVCELSPSQLINFKSFFFAALGIAAVIAAWVFTNENLVLLLAIIPASYAFWKWLQVKSMKLKITDQRLIITHGVFNKTTNETELYRVRDSSIEEPFLYRICGLGNVLVFTTDEANGVLQFKAFKKPHWIKDQVRNHSELCRQKKRWGNDTVLIHDHIA
ncbi:MAG TPA: PH domain-containing protein [Flavisolibacter sp.]|nr:PH domain-containing protein [Flavisolibacter sp.]